MNRIEVVKFLENWGVMDSHNTFAAVTDLLNQLDGKKIKINVDPVKGLMVETD